MNMLAAPELVHYIDDKIVDFYLKALRIFLDATKGKLHAILIGDDLGSQLDLMISPEMVQEFVIPGAKKVYRPDPQLWRQGDLSLLRLNLSEPSPC